MSRFDDTIGVRRDEVGSLVDELSTRLQTVEDATAKLANPGTDLPFVDSTFAPIYDRSNKKHVYVTLRFGIPGNTYKLHIVIVERALATTASLYKQNRFKTTLVQAIEDEERDAQSITDRVDSGLKYSTQYDVVRLIAENNVGDTVANPTNTNFAPTTGEPLGYPGNVLFTFTTPAQFGAPPFPVLADIDTQLDFETDGYDAYAIILNICPLHPETGAVQTYRQANIDWVQNEIQRAYPAPTGTVTIPEKHLLTDTDLDAVMGPGAFAGRGFCRVKFIKLVPGASYSLTAVTVHTVDGKRTTTGAVAFIAGSLSRTISGGALTNVALEFTSTDPFDDGSHVNVALLFTQPWPSPASLKNITQDYKDNAVTPWTQLLHKEPIPQNDLYHVQVNAGTISIGNGSTAVTGVGTNMTRWEAGWKIKVGAQTLTIAVKPTSDTAATVTTASVGAVVTQAYTMVMRIPLHAIKVKPTKTYNNEVRLLARGGDLLTITGNVTIGADGHIVQDTAVPGPAGLNTPKLWFKRGKLHMRMSMSGLTNINSLSTIEATIGTGLASLNLDNLDTDTAAGASVYYQVGRDDCNIVIPVSLKQARRIFGDVQLAGNFRLTNSIGQTPSNVSNLLSLLSGLSDYSPNSGGSNELYNGDFTNDNGVTSTTLGLWEQYRISNGNFLVIDTATTRGRWDQTNHLVFFRQNDSSTNKVYIYQSLFQTLVFGDFHSFSFFVSSDSSLTANLDVFIGAIIEPLTGSWSINGTTTVTGSGGGAALTELVAGAEVAINNEVRTVLNVANNNSFTVTAAFSTTAGPTTCHAVVPVSDVVQVGSQFYSTVEKYIEVTVQISLSLAANFSARDLYILFRTSTTISAAGPYLQLGRVMMAPGKTPVQFDRKNIKERNTTTTGTNGAGAAIPSEDLSFVPAGGIAGDRQDSSGALGDTPSSGGFLIA